MDFKVYQVYEDISIDKGKKLQKYLVDTDFFEGEHRLKYLINNDVEYEDGIITGTLSQEYIPNSYEVKQDKSIRPIENIEPYERTFFAFDIRTRAFLVQNRTYSPQNLNPNKTLTRLEEIMYDAFRNVNNSPFTPVPVVLPEDNSYFISFFNSHRVIELSVSGLNEGRLLGDNVTLSGDPKEDKKMKEIWNNDSSLTDLIHLRTTKDGDLNNSILAIAALNAPAAIIQMIKYYDPEEDGYVTLKRSHLDKFTVPNIDKNTESITAFQAIINSIRENRKILRRMRQI